MVAWNFKEPALNAYKPLSAPLLAGTRDDRLRVFGDGSTSSELAAMERINASCILCDRLIFAGNGLCPDCEPVLDEMIERDLLEEAARNHNDTADDLEERNDWSERLQDPTSEPW